MSAFKFDPKERERLKSLIPSKIVYPGDVIPQDEIIDRIESIISEREAWISVETKTPDYDGEYLCVCHEVEECGEEYDRIKIAELYMNEWQNRFNSKTSIVTHWQPLPNPPKDNKK